MESHRLILGVLVAAIIIGALAIGKPTITGFVPTETYSQELNLDVSESQRFVLTPSDGNIITMSSFSVSGSVVGTGLINIYLTDGDIKSLVYSNKKRKGSSMAQITGLGTRSLNIEPGERLDKIESLPDNYVTVQGAFTNQCIDTCIISEDMFNLEKLFLDVVVEPGTSVHISGVRFNSGGE